MPTGRGLAHADAQPLYGVPLVGAATPLHPSEWPLGAGSKPAPTPHGSSPIETYDEPLYQMPPAFLALRGHSGLWSCTRQDLSPLRLP